MKPENKWYGYFAMPNERNKERLNYYLDKAYEIVSHEEVHEAEFRLYIIFLKKIILELPEELLCNAYYDEDGYSDFISWSDTGTDDGFGSLSLSRYSELNPIKQKVDNFLRFNISEHRTARISMTKLLYSINLDDSEEVFKKFMGNITKVLKLSYGRENQLG